MVVTKENFRYVHAAFAAVEADNGFHHYERLVNGRDCDYNKRTYNVPAPFDDLLVIVNATLQVMMPGELETVCTGEHEEQMAILDSYSEDGTMVGTLLNALLNAFFNEWIED
jgi:hypothetical protein